MNNKIKSIKFIIFFLYKINFVKLANYIARFSKNLYGLINNYFFKTKNYDDIWWDENFYESVISDNSTISKSIDKYSSAYHYASIELLICRELFENRNNLNLTNVLDIGSGSGHWIDFYKNFGAQEIYGIDLSRKSIEFLNKKYEKDNVNLINEKALIALKKISLKFDIINAIGVMFHIVDDKEWEETLKEISSHIKSSGILIVGGYFGFINGLNVQQNEHGVNKRLRSRFIWKKKLLNNGFENIKFVNNHTAYDIKRLLPENNLLIAIKK